ncbi:unnamed protein product [Ceratitis capitata]|uniref:(Mediterranean fruit fly) hypothetical protein n=1 Tax=Ceratitis capitata TaxID=7213 RepID=A0A811V1R0_CERCA|nr:unnamed protein product [Ceratitis capitata]
MELKSWSAKPKIGKRHKRIIGVLRVRNIFRRGTKLDYQHSGSFLEAIGPESQDAVNEFGITFATPQPLQLALLSGHWHKAV